MAKANLLLPNGTKVNIEGNADEVAALLERYSQLSSKNDVQQEIKRKKKPTKSGTKRSVVRREGPQKLIADLAAEKYFNTKRTIADVQKKLEEKGHIYAQESLSPALIRLTRKKTLRRLKEKKSWVYVQ